MAAKKSLSVLDVYNRMKKYDEDDNEFLDIEEFGKFFKELLNADEDDVNKIYWKMVDDELGNMTGIEYKKVYLLMLNEGNNLKTKKKVKTKVPILDEEGNLSGEHENVTKEMFVDDEDKILDWLWEYGGAVDEGNDEIDYEGMAAFAADHGELDALQDSIFEKDGGIGNVDYTAQHSTVPLGKAPKKKGARKGPPPKKGKKPAGAKGKVGVTTKAKADRVAALTRKGRTGAGAAKKGARKGARKKAAPAAGGVSAIKPGADVEVTDGKYKGKKGVTEKFLASKKKWGCKLAIGKKVLLSPSQFKLC